MRVIRKPLDTTYRVVKTFSKPSRTKQSSKTECDINTILAKYKKTGILPHVNGKPGVYVDVPENVDFQACQNFIIEANALFMQLPAALRKRFGNDPAEFLAFADDPANAEEMIQLGLAVRREPPPKAEPDAPETAPAPEAAPAQSST